jgi:predicted Fe-S protein YdhL (DUF1289 family)
MKRIFRTITGIAAWIAVPAAAGYAITLLWNWLMPALCGFAAISYPQGVGLFLLGQFLSAGFIIGLFLLGGFCHAAVHRGAHRNHWHDMTDEERREFFDRRREWFDMMHSRRHKSSNTAAQTDEKE